MLGSSVKWKSTVYKPQQVNVGSSEPDWVTFQGAVGLESMEVWQKWAGSWKVQG